MLVSTKGRYALRVMVELADRADNGYIPLNAIAESQNISEKYLESIIVILSKAKFVDGLRGKGGGYKLSRKAEEYTVGSILRTVEGSLAPVNCLKSDENTCENADNCKTLPLWTKLDDIINDYLESVSLADLAEGKID
ncbi:MAG: RrF2 family transcriptional regulator [Acutalibacteraceae bacterium]|nr:Rrf2 family transcriptional regulator [Oscillospiraceae bacterium]